MSGFEWQNILSKESKLTLMEVPKELHFSTLPLVYQVRLISKHLDFGPSHQQQSNLFIP